ncbi:putative maltose permease [Fusarium bulbicola]|nr:putative maltose permease [Fusarium bulbicola]
MDLASQAATASGRRPIDGWHSRPESAINTERPSLAFYIDYNHKEHTFPPPSHNRKVSVEKSDEFESPNPLDDLRNARRAVNDEHEQTVRNAVKSYHKAIFWSLYLSAAVIMEGYDTSLVYSFFGLPAFANKYGTLRQDGLYSLSAPWQSALGKGAMVGQFFGLIITGYATDLHGFRRTAAAACILNAAFIFILFFAPNIETLLTGQILLGLPLGSFLTLTTFYTAEISPLALRPYLETWVNICWSIGKLMASAVLRSYSEDTTKWVYRVPWAVQWIFPPFILLGVVFAPESPWWLIRQQRIEDAGKSLLRLSSGLTDEKVSNTLSQTILTNTQERELQAGTSYLDCFRGTNLRRTEISCVAQTMQPLVGFALVLWTTSFFQTQSLTANDAFNLSLGQNAVGLVAGILLWFIMPRVGRRTIYLCGLGAIFVLQITIGALGVPTYTKATAWSTGALIMGFYLCYSLSVGPMSYIISVEVPSTRLRNKIAVLERNVYHIGSVFNNTLTTYMISPAGWGWQGKTAFCDSAAERMGP